MSQIHNQTSLSPADLAAFPAGSISLVDVRKPGARAASGMTIPGALWRHPFDAANWAGEFRGTKVVVYCVHGHEVSQAVRGYLADMGIEALLLEGGFEAWQQSGLPLEPVAEADA